MVGKVGDGTGTMGQRIDGPDQVGLHLARINPGGGTEYLKIRPGAVVQSLNEMHQFDIGVATPLGRLTCG